jgi:hypothetical protein
LRACVHSSMLTLFQPVMAAEQAAEWQPMNQTTRQ